MSIHDPKSLQQKKMSHQIFEDSMSFNHHQNVDCLAQIWVWLSQCMNIFWWCRTHTVGPLRPDAPHPQAPNPNARCLQIRKALLYSWYWNHISWKRMRLQSLWSFLELLANEFSSSSVSWSSVDKSGIRIVIILIEFDQHKKVLHRLTSDWMMIDSNRGSCCRCLVFGQKSSALPEVYKLVFLNFEF